MSLALQGWTYTYVFLWVMSSLMMHVSTLIAYSSLGAEFNYFYYFYFEFKIVRLFLVGLFLLILRKEDIFRCIFMASVHDDRSI